jgi:glycosyltransferase involved in cell wall biosynthesis
MHVGYFIEAFSTFVLREIEALRARGVKVSVFSVLKPPRDWPAGTPERDWPLRNEVIFPNTSDAMTTGAFYLLIAPRRMCMGVRRARELGANHRKLLRSACFAREARQRGLTQLHGTFATWPAEHASLVSAMTGLPYSFSVHAYDLFLPNIGLAKKIRYASGVRAISNFNAGILQDRFPEAAARISVVRLGVQISDNPRLQIAPCQKDEAFRLLSVGNLVPKKGFDLAISAVEQLLAQGRKVQLTIVGDGPLRSKVEARIRASRWSEGFRLTGSLPNEEVQTLLRTSHAAILACRKAADSNMDGIPVFLMEAMATGIPVISTRVSGVPELIGCDRTGLLAEPEDAKALTDAIERLMDDPELRLRLAACAVELIRSEYNLDTQLGSFISFLERVEETGASAP